MSRVAPSLEALLLLAAMTETYEPEGEIRARLRRASDSSRLFDVLRSRGYVERTQVAYDDRNNGGRNRYKWTRTPLGTQIVRAAAETMLGLLADPNAPERALALARLLETR